MLKRPAMCILLIALASSIVLAAEKAQIKSDQSAVCPFVFPAPKIDGKLDDACWKAAPQISELVLSDKPVAADPKTSVSLACDDAGLYMAFRCAEPDMSKVASSNQSEIWMNDSLEIFLDADRDRNRYQHLILDIAGRKFQETATGVLENADRNWNDPWEAAVVKGGSEWTAEVFIPWKTMGIEYQPGAAIRANFGRNRPLNNMLASWNVTGSSFHNLLRFGNVFIVKRHTEAKGILALRSDARAGKADGWITIDGMANEPSTLTPVVQVYPATDKPMILPVARAYPISTTDIPVSLNMPEPRLYNIDIFAQDRTGEEKWLMQSYQVLLPFPQMGRLISRPKWGSIWQANATFKVMPGQDVPTERAESVRISAAGNEYEPFQVVLRPDRALENLRASVSAFKGPATIAAANVSIKLVETVPVTIPTGDDSAPGDYPDPLPPFKPMNVSAGKNTALWFTVYVPVGTKAGEYKGTVTLSADGSEPVSIPVELRVWGFSLPKVSYLRTAYGHDPGGLAAWHGAKTLEEKREITRLLNRDFIEHRISPYSPMGFSDPKVEVKDGKITIDWTDFDKAATEYLPRMNAFNLPFSWMADFFGTKPGTPEYRALKGDFLKQMAQHLREKGWMEKGYAYVWDEPEPDMYQKIVDEAKMWHDADPAYQVLLTEQPEKSMAGQINVYVPILPNYNDDTCPARQKAGDQVWWYVCCGPHHPYPNNFIDYPAIDHRILHWMNWKYGVTGVLYWQTQWWQDNPWTTPMSYTPDHGGKWGNGDGHLLYPAVKEKSDKFVAQGPVDSIRWEMIREGVEDYDYLRMLADAVNKAASDPKKADAVEAGKEALAEADSLIGSRTDYSRNPERLYDVREHVAEALENLTR